MARYYSAISRIKDHVYVHMKSGMKSTDQLLRELRKHPDVEDVSPNYRVYAVETFPNDPRFDDLWGLHNTGTGGGTSDMDIDAAASLTLTSPNGGENWLLGSSHNITWDAPGVTGNMKITLWKDGTLIGVIADNVSAAPGSYAWTVGQYDGGTVSSGTGYTVKIKEKGTTVADTSDASFSLTN